MYNRIKNAIRLFIWALKNPQLLQFANFKLFSDLYILMLKVAKEERPFMTQIAYVHPTGEEMPIVSVWVGFGIAASPYKRITELVTENNMLKSELQKIKKSL